MKSQYMKTALITAAASLAFAAPALAGEDTTTFQVTATVADSCTITAEDLAFGTYDPNDSSALDGSSTITATCTEGTEYDIGLDLGGNESNATSPSSRAMIASGSYLNYELYSEEGHSSVWNTTETVAKTAKGAKDGVNEHTVYGQIPAAQYVPAGNYSDTINVTITY